MPPRENHELTADEIEQAGRMLMPMFVTAVQVELKSLRTDLTGALAVQDSHQKTEIQGLTRAIKELDERIAILEKLKWKALAAWSFLVAVITLGFNWLLRKLGLKD